MTKRDLAVRISDEVSFTQEATHSIVQKTLDLITHELSAARTVEFRNFGVFELAVRKSRVGRNPKNPENEVIIPERVQVKFKMGKVMREKVSSLKGSL